VARVATGVGIAVGAASRRAGDPSVITPAVISASNSYWSQFVHYAISPGRWNRHHTPLVNHIGGESGITKPFIIPPVTPPAPMPWCGVGSAPAQGMLTVMTIGGIVVHSCFRAYGTR
jgi:hypothetical protein